MCSLCQSAVKAKERRKLHSDSTKHVLPVLLEFSGALETPATETLFHSKAFLCRPCVRNVEKLQKLRGDLREKETEIRQQIDRLVQAHGLERAPSRQDEPEQGTTPRKKRSASAAEFESPTGRVKRRHYDTLTRESLQRMCPTGVSPVVAVSCMCLRSLTTQTLALFNNFLPEIILCIAR